MDVLYIKKSSEDVTEFYDYVRGEEGKVAYSLVGKNITAKYFNELDCWKCQNYLAEIYINDELGFGDYQKRINFVNSNEYKFINYPFLLIVGFLF